MRRERGRQKGDGEEGEEEEKNKEKGEGSEEERLSNERGKDRKEKGGRRGTDDPHLAGRGELTSHLIHVFLPSVSRQIWDVSVTAASGEKEDAGSRPPHPSSSDTV